MRAGHSIRPLVAGVMAMALALGGCGSGGGDGGKSKQASTLPGRGRPPIRLGTKNFTEEYVLGQLYKQALEAKGYSVVLKNDIGSSEIIDRALTSGGIDMYPEYTGVIAQEIAHESRLPKTPEETYRRAKAFEAKRGFAILGKTPGSDVLANVVKPRFARSRHLKTTTDLKRIGLFRYGGPAENRTRFQGAVGMRKVYGLTFRYVPLAIEQRYTALDSGRVDVVSGFSTDAELSDRSRYVVLDDPRVIFGFQNIVPVVSRKLLAREGAPFTRTLDAVSARLTNEALRMLNAEVELKKRAPAAVAREFLQRNGLI